MLPVTLREDRPNKSARIIHHICLRRMQCDVRTTLLENCDQLLFAIVRARLQGIGHAGVARSRRRGVTIAPDSDGAAPDFQ